MNDDMKRLVRVQDIISEIEAVQEKIGAIPVEVARLEKSCSPRRKTSNRTGARPGARKTADAWRWS